MVAKISAAILVIASITPHTVFAQGRPTAATATNVDVSPSRRGAFALPLPANQTPEICNDGMDNDLDGYVDAADGDCGQTDQDGDGFINVTAGGTDCNDSDASIFPGATEVADNQDNDCDGDVDEVTGSGFSVSSTGNTTSSGSSASTTTTSTTYTGTNGSPSVGGVNVGYTAATGVTATGATSTNSYTNSGATAEICNDGVDNDLDGNVDFADSDCSSQSDIDLDGFISHQAGGQDCDDNNPAVNPSAADPANDGNDWNCDGND